MNGSWRIPPAAIVPNAVAVSMACGLAGPSTFDGVATRPGVSSGMPSRVATSTVRSGPYSTFSCAYTVLTESCVARIRSMLPRLRESKLETSKS